MTTPTPSSRVIDPAGAVFGIAVPVLAAAAVVVLTYLLRSRLPAQIATQWSGSAATSFTSPTASAWSLAAIVVLVGGGCSAIAALAQARLMMRRTMLLIGLTVVGVITASGIGLVLGQLDASTSAAAATPVGAIGLGGLLGALVGLLGAALLRDFRVRVVATAPPPPRLPRGAVELPIVDQVGMSAAGLLGTGLAIAAPAALVCLLADAWWPLGLFAPVVLLTLALLQFRLVVEADAVRVQNMGMSAVLYGTDEVLEARVAEVRPFRDFGGWGLKAKGRGNYGVVTRTGPAVVITFACGDRLTVTTPRAAEIAGALNTLADRQQRGLARS